jgi:[acyl-carrier-protein] S-malonyltransferase
LAVLCSGQGGQHPQLLQLVIGNAAGESVLREGAAVLGEDVRDWLARPEILFENRIAQPLICLAQLAIWSALEPLLPAPSAFAGYSVGELASYACAGAMGARDLAHLARVRAEMMDAAASKAGGLVAVSGLGRGDIASLCSGHAVWIAIVNGEEAFVVGGATADLAAFSADAGAKGAELTPLPVGLPAHTPLLARAAALFQHALDHSRLRAPKVPVLAGIDATWVTDRAIAAAKLDAQLSATIEWSRCLDALYERGCRVYLELGPGSALAHMARRRLGEHVDARSVEDFRSLEGIARWVRERYSS